MLEAVSMLRKRRYVESILSSMATYISGLNAA